MKILTLLMILFSSPVFSEDIAIEAVKNHPSIKTYLGDKALAQHQVKFNQMELGGQCGFTGCQWRKLVSVIVTSSTANASSITILALVSGRNPSNIGNISVKFVEITEDNGNVFPKNSQ